MPHSSPYRFYIQRYPINGVSQPVYDLEEHFNCSYKAITGNSQTAVKNFYEENYAEASGNRIWLPERPEDVAYSASELTLELLFKSNEDYAVLTDEQNFLDFITARKFEYHDTFRPNRYWQLTFVDAPETKGEILYGGQQYRWVAFKLKNWGGKFYSTSLL